MRLWIVATAATVLLWPAAAGAATPDAKQVASRVAATLRESGELQNYRVGVKYEDGVAWLLGSVTSEAQSAAAARLAGQTEGVAHVVNRLEIIPAATPESTAPETASQPDDLLLTMLEAAPEATPSSSPEMGSDATPAPLPPNPQAMPAPTMTRPAMPQAGARMASRGMPRPMARTAPAGTPQGVQPAQYGASYAGGMPQGMSTAGAQGVSYDQASMPGYAWPSYASHPNYAAVTYPQQYSPAAWPYIGPFYPYPQVPLGWRKVTLEWDDGWWFLDFSHQETH